MCIHRTKNKNQSARQREAFLFCALNDGKDCRCLEKGFVKYFILATFTFKQGFPVSFFYLPNMDTIFLAFYTAVSPTPYLFFLSF